MVAGKITKKAVKSRSLLSFFFVWNEKRGFRMCGTLFVREEDGPLRFYFFAS